MKKVFKYSLVVLLIGIVVYIFVWLYNNSLPKEKVYEIEEVVTGNIEKQTVATGKVEPRTEILIKPQMSGIIDQVYKEAGQTVKAGEVIARIKVIPDMVSLSSAESRLTLAQQNFEQSTKDLQRQQKLFEDNVVSREELEKVELQYQNNKEELKAAENNLSLVRDGVSNDKTMVSNTLVRSTINGTILDVPIKVGNSVIQSNNFNDGTTIATVADMSDMIFVGKLDETEVGRIRTGMPIDIIIGALQDKKFNAVLEYVSPKGVEENGAIMFEMKAAVTVPKDVEIRAGYSANAEIVLKRADSVLIIPENCTEFSGDSIFVYLLKTEKPQTFERKQVQVGISDGIRIQIKEGLNEKDKVRGLEKIKTKSISIGGEA